MNKIMSRDYRDYVIKDGKFIGAFEEMYQNIEDPWYHRDATALQYDLALLLIERHKICSNGGEVLDLGCGKGAFTSRLKASISKANILAIDISPTAIKKAETIHGKNGIVYQVMDLQKKYDKINGEYDLIIMSQLMWYILPLFEDIVHHLSKKLTDDGYFLINQTFYKPEDQKYGEEIVSTVEDMLRLMNLEVTEMIETNRLSNHNVVALLR